MERRVQRELLDHLEPLDESAVRSRQDLRRLNAIMGQATKLASGLRDCCAHVAPSCVVELGAGDGTLLLAVAQKLGWRGTRAVLVDQRRIIEETTLQAFLALNWRVEVTEADVFAWLAQSTPRSGLTVVLANLFLHHFTEAQLADMFLLASRKAEAFVAAEPRRCETALFCSRLVGLVGCNAITRHDAPVSVQAGFSGNELSALWPRNTEWVTTERPAGLFSHLFTARLRE